MQLKLTPSQQAKEAGLKNLLQVQQLTGQSAQTLTNWHRDKPELFKIVLIGCSDNMKNNGIKEILMAAAHVVLMRHGDVSTEDGSFATVDTDALLRLDYALAEHFKLDSDDVTFKNIDDLIAKIQKT